MTEPLQTPPAAPAAEADPGTVRRRSFARLRGEDPDADPYLRAILAIDALHASTGPLDEARKLFEGLLDRAEAGLEGRALVIYGDTGAGKSHIARHILDRPDLRPFRAPPETSIVRPLLEFDAPAPCTLLTLGKTALEELGYPVRDGLREHQVWSRVRAQLIGQRNAITKIDEAHNLLLGKNEQERKKIAATFKQVLIGGRRPGYGLPGSILMEYDEEPHDDARWPVQLVLIGTMELMDFLEEHPELLRRCVRLPVNPLRWPQDEGRLLDFLGDLDDGLKFPVPPGFTALDMPHRFHKAGNGHYGRMAQLAQAGALLALRENPAEPRLTRRHLAVVFEHAFRLGRDRNPFFVADIAACPPAPDPTEEVLTRLRGAAKPDGVAA